jgi:hypothetical protein
MKFVTEKFLSTEQLEDFSIIDTTFIAGDSTKWIDKQGNCHREDGPAYIGNGGQVKYWYCHGQLHRTDGPAIETPGVTQWLINGITHREDGPALIRDGLPSLYFLHGKPASESDVRALGKMK